VSTADIAFLSELEAIVRARLSDGAADSYTVQLADAGAKRLAQKVGEEGVELALAAVSGDSQEVVNETADLIYHVIVLLAVQNLELADVSKALQLRHRGA